MIERNGQQSTEGDVFRYAREVTVRNLRDLIDNHITVHPNYVERRWGESAVEEYRTVIAARVRSELAAKNTPTPTERGVGIGRFR